MRNALYRTMALDVGDVRIGIALSDLSGTIANGFKTLTRSTIEADMSNIMSIIKEQQVKEIVLGLPINMDGTSGDRVVKTKEFAQELSKHTDLAIKFLDERLTTVMAEKVLISADVSRKKRKNVIDKLAATIILQDYLDTTKR